MTIRAYVPADREACVRLYVDVFNGEPWNDEWTLERAGLYLADIEHTPGFKGIVAAEEDAVHGFIVGYKKHWWQGDEFFVQEMCVGADKQRSGIGASLMAALEQALAAEGVHDLALLTDRGTPAERFYKKNGYREVERLVFLAKHVE